MRLRLLTSPLRWPRPAVSANMRYHQTLSGHALRRCSSAAERDRRGSGCWVPPAPRRASLIQEGSWLASAPWKPRKDALVPAAVWSSPQRTRAAGAGLLAARILAGHACGWEGHFRDRTVANSARPGCTVPCRDEISHWAHRPPARETHRSSRHAELRPATTREEKTLRKTDFNFPNRTPTQTVSLIPTPRLYTKVRTSL